MVKKTIILFFVSLFTFLPLLNCSNIVFAQEAKVIRLAFSEHPPWKLILENGEIGGIDTDFFRLIASKMNLKVEIVQIPFKRGLAMLKAGTVDCMTGVLKRSEREQYLYFLDPPYKTSSNKAFYLEKGKGHLVKKYEDLYNLRIGTGIGAKYFPRFDQDTKLKKEVAPKVILCLRQLERRRIDVWIHTETTGDYLILKNGYQDKVEKAPYVYKNSINVYIVLSKKSTFVDRIDEFESYIKMFVEDGTLKKIQDAFFSNIP
jgi:polar amino acid transport system substrate-binding protein